MILEIASILFTCVAANHLGLVAAIEETAGRSIPIVNCPKCFTFWSVLVYTFSSGGAMTYGAAPMLVISFLCAWFAIWLDLGMGIIDRLYLEIYGKIYPTDSADTHPLCADDPMPGLPQQAAHPDGSSPSTASETL